MLDQEYDVTLSGTELQTCNSVADLYAKVKDARPDAP
jgi:acyl carrier protein